MKRTSTHSNNSSYSSISCDEESYCKVLNDTYSLLRVIGKGATSEVWLARHIDLPELQFAIKIISKEYMKQNGSMDNISKEIDVLNQMNYEGIVRMYEYGYHGTVTRGHV